MSHVDRRRWCEPQAEPESVVTEVCVVLCIFVVWPLFIGLVGLAVGVQ